MLVNSLETMESIVANNKSLKWDGWDVLEIIPSPTAWRKPNGAYIDGKWYTRKRFTLSANGWEIPNKLMR